MLLTACGQPPVETMSAARRAMTRAAEADGARRAPSYCATAQASLTQAEAELRLQQKRSAWSRDFEETWDLAYKALRDTQSCAVHASAARDLRRLRAEAGLRDLAAAIDRTAALARHVPDGEGVKNDILKAEITLGEGRISFGRGDYERAEQTARRGRIQVGEAVSAVGRFIDEFRDSSQIPSWRRWVKETVRVSERENRNVIIVDKLRRQLLVVRGPEDIATYIVDLGVGGIESKTRAGDESTPEGRYSVTEVRGIGQTRYYRALMLNYPNDEDRARFRALKRAGQVPRRGGIGSNIEIHGNGGRAQDWTQGCVALSNPDMDHLVSLVKVGTPVTIVGMIPDGALE